MPLSNSSSSLWPLPDTPARPTISPERSVRPTSCSRVTPSASRQRSPAASSRTSPPIAWGRVSRPMATLRPIIAAASAATELSATAVSCTTRPARMTVTRWHSCITSFSLWVISRRVVPCVASRASTWNSACVSCGVSTAVGSSRIRIFAPRTSALRISSRCRSPTGRSATWASNGTFRPVDCISASSRLRIAASAGRSRACDSAPSSTFSSAVSVSTSMKCWCTMPMPSAMASCGLRICTDLPKTSMRPLSAAWKPYSTDISVLLPAPFSPTMPCTVPAATVRSTASLACTAPKRLQMPRNATAGTPLGGRRGTGSAGPPAAPPWAGGRRP